MSHVLAKGAPPAVRPAPARGSVLRRFLTRPEVGSLLGAVVVFVFFFVLAPPFRNVDSMATVLYQSATIGLMAVPVALLMIGGEYDLSAGVSVTTAALAAAMFNYQFNTNVWVGIVFSLLLALGIGLLNGYLVMRTKLPSFLITLATFLMLQGLNLAITKLLSGGVATNNINDMAGFETARAVFAAQIPIWGGGAVSIAVVWWIVFVAVATWILLRTRQGNWIFAVGGKQESALAVGVPVKRTKIGLFMAVGFTAWFTGMHLLFAFNTIQAGLGVGNELLYIAAAVIGGCLLTGGFGSAVGSAIGALIFGMTTQGIVYAGWNPDWFKFFLGATLLLATLVNIWVRLRAVKR
jgi:simple sugar transport system permease protein